MWLCRFLGTGKSLHCVRWGCMVGVSIVYVAKGLGEKSIVYVA